MEFLSVNNDKVYLFFAKILFFLFCIIRLELFLIRTKIVKEKDLLTIIAQILLFLFYGFMVPSYFIIIVLSPTLYLKLFFIVIIIVTIIPSIHILETKSKIFKIFYFFYVLFNFYFCF